MIQDIDGPMQGQMYYDIQRLSQLGMLGNWPHKYEANEHIQSPASPAVTVAPSQPWLPSPPPASDEQDAEERVKRQKVQ